MTLGPEEYTVATLATLKHRTDIADAVTKGAALVALKDNGSPAGLQVVPTHELEDVR